MKPGEVLRTVGGAFMAAAMTVHFLAVLRYGDNPQPPAGRWPFAVVAVEGALLIGGAALFLLTRGRR